MLVTTSSSRSRRRAALVGGVLLAVTAAGLTGPSAGAGPAPGRAASASAQPSKGGGAHGETPGNFDARTVTSRTVLRSTAEVLGRRGDAVAKLAGRLGADAEIELDGVTGTPRHVADRTGFLTGASGRAADAVALGWVRDNLAGLGLARADLDTLVERQQVTDINGITHVSWVQQVDGVPVFGNGLRAHVDRRGRLIAVQGAPVAHLAALAARAPDAQLGAADATRAAVRDVRGKTSELRDGSTAEQVWFATPGGLRAGWLTYTKPGAAEAYQHVVDAVSGRTLYRHSTMNFERGDGLVFDNYPGARGPQRGGTQRVVDLFRRGFLPRNATWMKGRWASVWADVNDDDRVQPAEKTRVPNAPRAAQFRFVPFRTARNQVLCAKAFQCTWNPNQPYSWRRNKNQDGVQGLYYTSAFAEWLSKAPFGFTAAMGNFRRDGGDPVLVHSMDGADTDSGLPDGSHVNNANFNTPPDGTSPIMQMYLNRAPGYLAASSTNAVDNIAHEYTHGLSNRLVVDSGGNSTLNSYQAGAMGEAWGDFYSMDYLVTKRLATDTRAAGELMYDRYLSKNRAYTRSQAIDCPTRKTAPLCTRVSGRGGYTYGDIPTELTTEVHGAGEVWAQTMWDVRRALGHRVTMRVVTAAMSLAPSDPSMLDMRDAMLTADKAIYGKAHWTALWRAFAHRGFGYFAASVDAADPDPIEDFRVPPPASATRGSISGTVTDTNGSPLAGAVVLVAGQGEDAATVTNQDGGYTIDGLVEGTYPKVAAFAAGYETQFRPVTVDGDETGVDFELRRDWAASSGGASIASFDPPDFTAYGCGPDAAIDLSLGTGWGSETTATGASADDASDVDPKSIVIELPEAITVTGFAVDPSATCGDAGSSSTADYTIEVGPSAAGPWTVAASGTFGPADRGHLVDVPALSPAPGTTHVQYTMESPQVPDWTECPDGYTGCTYMDTTEVAVYDD